MNNFVMIEAVWNNDDFNIVHYKELNINLSQLSEYYVSEEGQNIIIMSSGCEYIVRNFDFLKEK